MEDEESSEGIHTCSVLVSFVLIFDVDTSVYGLCIDT